MYFWMGDGGVERGARAIRGARALDIFVNCLDKARTGSEEFSVVLVLLFLGAFLLEARMRRAFFLGVLNWELVLRRGIGDDESLGAFGARGHA